MSSTTASPEAVAESQTVDLQAIVRRFGEKLNRTRRLHTTQRKTLWSIAHCRTPAMGGHVERCRQCDFVRYQYHSCRNRQCPQCQTLATAADWMRELLGREIGRCPCCGEPLACNRLPPAESPLLAALPATHFDPWDTS